MSESAWKEEKESRGIVFSAVVAMAPDRLIGKDGGMPWHISEDLKVFRRLTTGHPVLMGRKTFDSLGKPLPNRQNIVISRDPAWYAEGAEHVVSPGGLFGLELMDREVCVIGGAQVYALMMPLTDLLWVSRVRRQYEGDTWFPAFEEAFPFSRKMLVFDDFDLMLYAKEAAMLDSEYARRMEG